MALSVGTRLGSYEIIAAIGAGGMGEVYRARDTKLNRDVALKVLPDSFADDPDRLARFQREAQVLASLNHPHIGAIYGLEESGGVRALVLELVEGPTLAEVIAGGTARALKIEDALPIARQIADALEAAHERGIVHRDLKPANVKVRPDGMVKVLDFGLAKLWAGEAGGPGGDDPANSPTMTAAATRMGMILGTAAYMSPEQARGKPVDKRADIWAFGCVLFEMITGARAFAGEGVSDVLARIIEREPDFGALPPTTPPLILRLLRRCLEKDRRRRLADIADARFEIEEAIAAPTTSAPRAVAEVRSGARWMRAVPWALAAVAFGVAVWALWIGPRQGASSSRSTTRWELNLPAGVELFTGNPGTVAVSPDGTRVAFVGILGGARQIYVRRFDSFEAIPVRGTENASSCFFSPDSRSIGFITNASVLKKVSLSDGLVATVAPDASFLYGAAWGPDDRIVFVRSGALWQVPASGGAPKRLTMFGGEKHETVQVSPTVLPGGNAILLASTAGGGAASAHIESLALATGERRILVERGAWPLYAPSGHVIFFRDGELLAAPFDAARLQLTGAPVRVVENLPEGGGGAPVIDVSAAGALVYAATTATGHLVWVSRQGAEQPLIETLRSYTNPRITPDGSRVLVQVRDLWIQDLARATFTRLTTSGEALALAFPVWTRDGRRVVFRTPTGLRVLDGDGSGRGEAISGTSDTDYPGSFSADGETLVFIRNSLETSFDVFALSLHGDATPRPIVKTLAYEGGARLSPDGRWIAYSSNESGQMEVYLRPFPGPDRKTLVSTQGGTQVVWNPSGKELFYRSGNKMMVVEVAARPDLTLSQPRLLFEQRYAFGAGATIANYDVSPDGQRFVMVKEESSAGRLNVVLNWFDELRARVPTAR